MVNGQSAVPKNNTVVIRCLSPKQSKQHRPPPTPPTPTTPRPIERANISEYIYTQIHIYIVFVAVCERKFVWCSYIFMYI